jgi:hypothetical protein
VSASARPWRGSGRLHRHAARPRAALDTFEPIPSTTLLLAQEAKERLRGIVEGFFFRRLKGEDTVLRNLDTATEVHPKSTILNKSSGDPYYPVYKLFLMFIQLRIAYRFYPPKMISNCVDADREIHCIPVEQIRSICALCKRNI